MRIPEKQLLKNVGTNGLGLFVTLFNQILLLPIYLHFWSMELYGDWIALSAISLFFSSSDLGFTTYFTNAFVVNHAQGNDDHCRRILTNNYCFLFALFIPLLILRIAFLWGFDIVKVLGLHNLNVPQANLLLVLLVIHVLLTMVGKVPNAVYRSSNLAHKAFLIDNLAWFSESLITAAVVMLRMSPIIVAIGIILPRLFVLFYKVFDTRKLFAYSFSFGDFSMNEIKEAFAPSVSIASFPFSNTVVMQGLSLVVNKYFGASELVLFNTSRTVANMIKFCSNIVTQSFYPEFSISYGIKDGKRVNQLSRYCVLSAVVISLLSALVILPFGGFIFRIWTGGKVTFVMSLMAAFLLVIVIDNLWNAILAPLISTNRHRALGFIVLCLSMLVVGVALFASRSGRVIQWIVLSQLLVHIPMLVIVMRERAHFSKQFADGQ